MVGLVDGIDPRMVGEDFLGVIGGPIIDDNHFIVGVVDFFQRSEA